MILLPLLAAGCGLARGVANVPQRTVKAVTGQPEQHLPARELQQQLMRFTDDYVGRVIVAMDVAAAKQPAVSPMEVLRLKLNCASSGYAIATGANETVNLLDMIVLVSLTRSLVEDEWIARYGEPVRPIADACVQSESNLWELAGAVLNPKQREELRQVLKQWRASRPDNRSVFFTRARGLSTKLSQEVATDATGSASVFSLLMIDPLSGLDPATREIAETRLFAERALYLAQRMPVVLRWQTELLALEMSETPVGKDLRRNATDISAALNRTSQAVEQIPQLLRSDLSNMTGEVKTTLDAARQLSDSLNTTLTTFDGLQKGMKKEAQPGAPSDPEKPSEPFRILDYAETAKSIDATVQHLNELLRTLESTLGSTNLERLTAHMTPAVQQAQRSSQEVVDYAFRRLIFLVIIACVAVLLTVLLYRRLRG